jgi:hypothetical protein
MSTLHVIYYFLLIFIRLNIFKIIYYRVCHDTYILFIAFYYYYYYYYYYLIVFLEIKIHNN